MSRRFVAGAKSALFLIVILFACGAAAQPGTVSVVNYGAKCDGQTNDEAAFQNAVNAANAQYVAKGAIIDVLVPYRCVVGTSSGNTTINVSSGVYLEGPGQILVPNQTAGILNFENASNSGVEGLDILVTSNPGGNNASLFAVGWKQTGSTAATYSHFIVRHNHIAHSNWGILVEYAAGNAGSGYLTDVDIEGNTVTSPLTSAGFYNDADGIHVAGSVNDITISGNRVSNRGDAAIALTNEVGGFNLVGATVDGNDLEEDRVGLDDSGGSDVVFSGNRVYATIATTNSNPAFRSIPYPPSAPVTPTNIIVSGNYFENGPSSEFAAKVDDFPTATQTNVTFSRNTMGSLYLRGVGIVVSNNRFLQNAQLVIDYNSKTPVPTSNVFIGKNFWLGNVHVAAGANASYIKNVYLIQQSTAGTTTIVNSQNLVLDN
jgi:hypothetical protein